MAVTDLNSVEIEVEDENDFSYAGDRCLRNRINDFINSKLRGKLKKEVQASRPASDNYEVTKNKNNVTAKTNGRKNNRNRNSTRPPRVRPKVANLNSCGSSDTNTKSANKRQRNNANLLFRPVTQIMRCVEKNQRRYTDVVSVEKHRSRRKIPHSMRPDPILTELSSSESEDEGIQRTELLERLMYGSSKHPGPSGEYWYVIKLLRLIRGCNPSTTVLCLCALRSTTVKSNEVQQAVLEAGGIQILLNLAAGTDLRCRLAALKLLKELSEINQNAKIITLLDGVRTLVELIRDENYDLKLLASEILARICHFNHARSKLRLEGGIEYLVCLLDISVTGSSNMKRSDDCSRMMLRCPQYDFKVGKAAACALWACSRSLRNRSTMREAGIIPILGRLLKANDSDFLVPVIGTLQECASDRHYQIGIRTEEMIPGLIEHLRIGSKWLKIQCATAFFKCGCDEVIQNLIRVHGGLQPLADLLVLAQTEDVVTFGASGAVWQAAKNFENAVHFESLGATQTLVDLLRRQPQDLDKFVKIATAASDRLGQLDHLEATLTNICGAISEMAKIPAAQKTLRVSGGLSILTSLLRSSSVALLYNINVSIGRCAVDKENLEIIQKMDGVRRLLSMLRHSDPSIQATAALALCPCIQASPDPGLIFRSFVGSIDSAVLLLDSRNEEVLTAACALVAEISKDAENLATLTDLGIVPVLADLVRTSNDAMRAKVAEAIANCCTLKGNAKFLGEEGVVRHLLQLYLSSSNPDVRLSATRALHHLSTDPRNAAEMNQAEVLRRLIRFLASDQEELQLAAVGTIGNIRRLTLAINVMKDKKASN